MGGLNVTLEDVRQQLIKSFSTWHIDFFEQSFIDKQYTHIKQLCGWHIYYQFGADDIGEYVEVYATHRMTGDSHYKVYTNEKRIHCPAYGTTYLVGHEDELTTYNNKVREIVYNPSTGILREGPDCNQVEQVYHANYNGD